MQQEKYLRIFFFPFSRQMHFFLCVKEAELDFVICIKIKFYHYILEVFFIIIIINYVKYRHVV